VLDDCTVGTTWELLNLDRDAWGLSGKSGIWCQTNVQHNKLSSPRVVNLVSRLPMHEVPSGCASSRPGCFVFINQQNPGYQPNRNNSSIYISILPAYTSILFSSRIEHTARNSTHRQNPELCWHHVTCTKQPQSFQTTPDNLQNFVHSLWASFHHVELYHNANASDVDSFQTGSDCTKGQPPRKGDGNC